MRCSVRELTGAGGLQPLQAKSFWFDLTDKHSVAKTLAIWAKQRLAACVSSTPTPRHF